MVRGNCTSRRSRRPVTTRSAPKCGSPSGSSDTSLQNFTLRTNHGNSVPPPFARGDKPRGNVKMSDHDPKSEMPASAPQPGGRQRRAYIAATVAGVALIAAFASSSLGQGLGHRVPAQVPGLAGARASLGGGSGPRLAVGWPCGPLDTATGPLIEAHADRMIRHLSVEIDATAEQQEKLRAIVRDAVKDLLPLREKVLAARATARELLTQQTIDRAAIEKFRADQIATH